MSKTLQLPSLETVVMVAFILLCVTGCPEPEPEPQPQAALLVLEKFDPDISNLQAPVPGTIMWWSTRAGTARFLANDGRELMPRVAVSGGELVVTPVWPGVLMPGLTDIEIYYVLQQQGGVVLRERVTFFLDAECTLHDHCPYGACSDFQCQ